MKNSNTITIVGGCGHIGLPLSDNGTIFSMIHEFSEHEQSEQKIVGNGK